MKTTDSTVLLALTMSLCWPLTVSATDPVTERAKALIQQYDGNGDGVLTRDEIDAAQLHRFVQIDFNQDRLISVAEAREWAGENGQNPTIWMRHLDRNGDGQLDVNEYVDQVVETIIAMDHNNNGWITRKEVRRSLQQAR